MRRVHLRGRKKVETDVGLAFMMMNLVKYWSRELLKLSFCHALGIFPTSKKGEARNIISSFTFFIYLIEFLWPQVALAEMQGDVHVSWLRGQDFLGSFAVLLSDQSRPGGSCLKSCHQPGRPRAGHRAANSGRLPGKRTGSRLCKPGKSL